VSPEEEDPRAELVRRLLEYERIKLAGQHLNELPRPDGFYSGAGLARREVEKGCRKSIPRTWRNAWLGLIARAR